jgi:uncharacterized protein YndB with AHSA1/START domain
MTTTSSELEIVTTRLIDAPRERVFAAFADAARLARWWGPKGFTNTFDEFELRPGGAWRFVMRGPDGKGYPNDSTFLEVHAPERIASCANTPSTLLTRPRGGSN